MVRFNSLITQYFNGHYYGYEQMQKLKFFKRITGLLLWLSLVFPQIEFNVNWTPYVTYYLSMVDINTGESNMPIFLATLERQLDAPESVEVDIEFEIIIDSDALGVDNETLVKLETKQPIILTAPIHISNMDLNLTTDQIFDSEGNPVALYMDLTEQLDMEQA